MSGAAHSAAQLPSNQGRWGADDELGTLNHIDDAARARAAAEVRTGATVSLAAVTASTPVVAGPGALRVRTAPGPVRHTPQYAGSPAIALAETLDIVTHDPRLTHIDALTHTIVEDKVYPGIPVSEAADFGGPRRGSTASFTAGIVTRGHLLDLAPGGTVAPGTAITGALLDDLCRTAKVHVEPGDAIVVRGGWPAHRAPGGPDGEPMPGFTLDGVRWLLEHDVSVQIGDVGDAHPPLDPGVRSPLHTVGIYLGGLVLVDAASPDPLAEHCHREGRFSFMLVLAPPSIPGLTGLPVNPLAVF